MYTRGYVGASWCSMFQSENAFKATTNDYCYKFSKAVIWTLWLHLRYTNCIVCTHGKRSAMRYDIYTIKCKFLICNFIAWPPPHNRYFISLHIDGLVQEKSNAIANALELLLSCTNPPVWGNVCCGQSYMAWVSNLETHRILYPDMISDIPY